jgi:colicin import membrane protein
MSIQEDFKRDRKQFTVWLGIAAAAHVALVVAAVLLQLYYLHTHPPLKIVSVSLVALPGTPGPAGGPSSSAPPAPPSPAPKAPKPAPKAPEPKAPEPPAVKKIPVAPVPKKAVPEPAPRNEQQNLDAALAKFRKDTQQRPAPSGIGNALANLQKRVASEGRGPATGSGTGGGGGLYGTGGGAVDPYKSKIAGIIQDNWLFSTQLIRSTKGMEVYVAISILPDGTISQIRYDRRAPSEYLNNSVKEALKKSSPLPPPPREYGRKPLWVGFVFTPEGISQ